MWLLIQREVGFVPNAVGSIVVVHIPGHSMRYRIGVCGNGDGP